jgi:hypothetical protein
LEEIEEKLEEATTAQKEAEVRVVLKYALS